MEGFTTYLANVLVYKAMNIEHNDGCTCKTHPGKTTRLYILPDERRGHGVCLLEYTVCSYVVTSEVGLEGARERILAKRR